MKVIGELLPLAIGVAFVGAVTWFLLDRDIGLGRWVLALLLFGHGWVHMMFLFPQPSGAGATTGGMEWPFDMGRSWLIPGGLDAGLIKAVGIALIVLALATALLAALATVSLLVPTAWWPFMVVASAISSLLLLILFYAPALLIGLAIDLVLVWFVIASIWSPAASTA